MANDALTAALERVKALEAERDAALAKASAAEKAANQPLRLKVSEKGGLSVYGLNAKFPATYYKQQWLRLAEFMPTIVAFIKANGDKLKDKAAKQDAPAQDAAPVSE